MSLLSRFFGFSPRLVWGVPEEQTRIVFENPTARGLLRASRPRRVVNSTDEGVLVENENWSAVSPPWDPRSLPAPKVNRLVIRPVWGSDHVEVERVCWRDRDWLEPWEATLPRGAKEQLPTLSEYQRRTDAEVEAGITLPMMIEADGKVVGMVTASNTVRGALYTTTLGYWIVSEYAGIGISSLAVAAVIDLLILKLGMHRVEINIRPENVPSLGLARKLRLREEGYKPRYMQIAGEWADHVAFAIDREELPEHGLVNEIWGPEANE
ncbi:MAG: GNAT family N-acetyltransferase [Actinomycetaceae bacterium]|nr:GNAT family N-acetyltransferase [Actinomycetaceae bacterium]